MYRLPNVALGQADVAALAAQQAVVDAEPTFPARVQMAKTRFGSKPQALFRQVRAGLRTMAGELVRCAYCEDGCADEVEHVRPKDFYPERVFDWTNYLYSCGPCNTGKNNNFAVLDAAGDAVDLVVHRRTQGVVPPPVGAEVFIDPRAEDPLDYLWLDVGGEFRFAILDEEDSVKATRAELTIKWLKLNREMLVAARRNAFGGYRDRLAQYAWRKAQGAPADELEQRRRDLAITPHRTVWLEMKRQREQLDQIGALFADVPELMAL